MKVLGVDPGTLVMGVGVVERRAGRLSLVHASAIPLGKGEPLEARLARALSEIERLILAERPDVVAVEDIFHAKNVRSALLLGHARGVVLAAAARAGIAVYSYPPAVVKRTVAGRGGADKGQVARLVAAILGHPAELPRDATDALAVAITHAQGAGALARLAEQAASAARPPAGRRGPARPGARRPHKT